MQYQSKMNNIRWYTQYR